MSKLVFQCVPKVNFYNRRILTSLVMDATIKTVGIIVIGDEILKGEVVDTNSSYMTSRLHNLGVQVKKISVIGDVIDEICEEVKEFSKKYTYVITTGGIGPTHDDMTFEAIAKAFNEPTILHPELVKICTKFYKTSDPNSPGMKLARVPKSSRLTYPESPKANYPNVCVGNVYIFPGIPQLCEKLFEVLSPRLFESSSKFYTKYIYFNVTEDKLARVLDMMVKEFPNVLFGSYPQLAHSDYKVKITIESTDENSATKAYRRLLESMPPETVVENYNNKSI